MLQKTKISNGKVKTDELGQAKDGDIAWNTLAGRRNFLHKSLIGKILLQLNWIKRRTPKQNAARWEIAANYAPTFLAGIWNKVRFSEEIIRGDYVQLTTEGWNFRAQVEGYYRIGGLLTMQVAMWYWADVALYKNETFYSHLRIRGLRVFDQINLVWHYDAIADLAFASDIVHLKEGDVIDIRLKFDAPEAGGGISDIAGHVNCTTLETKGKQIISTINTWGV
jgi:hypothetical protein